MQHSFSSSDLLTLHNDLCRRLLYAHKSELDNINSVDVQLHNVSAFAESLEYPTSLDRVWCSEQRWRTMIRQYLDPVNTQNWLDTIESAFPSSKRGICVLRTNTVEKRTAGKGTTRRWGSCMLSLSFRRIPQPQITLHSRTSYLGYLSLLDLGVAYTAGRYVSERTGIPVEEMSFLWSLEMAQYHGFRCLAFPLGAKEDRIQFHNTLRKFRHNADHMREYPGLRLAWMQYKKILDMDEKGTQYSEQTFSSSRRVRKRYHTQVKGLEFARQFAIGDDLPSDHRAYNKLPATSFDELDFSAIGIPL